MSKSPNTLLFPRLPFFCVAFSSSVLSKSDGDFPVLLRPHVGSRNGAPHHARLQLLADDDLEGGGGVDASVVGVVVGFGDGVVIG